MEEGDDMPKIVFTPEEERQITMMVEAHKRIKKADETSPSFGETLFGSLIGFCIVMAIILCGC